MLKCARNSWSCFCVLRRTGRQGRGPPSSNQVYRHGQETSGDDAVWGRVAVGACPQRGCTNRHQRSEEWRRGEGACTELADVCCVCQTWKHPQQQHADDFTRTIVSPFTFTYHCENVKLVICRYTECKRPPICTRGKPFLLSCMVFARLNQVIMVCISDGRANVPLSVSNGEPVSCCARQRFSLSVACKILWSPQWHDELPGCLCWLKAFV